MLKKLGPSSAVTESGIQISFDKDVIKYINGETCLIIDRSPIDETTKTFYVEIESINQHLSTLSKDLIQKEKEEIKNNINQFAALLGYKCLFI